MTRNADIPAPTRTPLRRAAAAMRSGLRRYPRTVLESFAVTPDHPGGHIHDLLHQLSPHELAVVWLGHASVVCQIADTTVAVDPVLSARIGPRVGRRTIGPARISEVPIAAESLRDTDLVLLTHAHFDHLDRPTLERMADRETIVIVPPGCARLVPKGYRCVIELSSETSTAVCGLCVTAIEPRHWGARKVVDRRRGVNSYLVERNNQRVLLAGDTAATDAFGAHGPVDLAVFGIGAYEPWDHMHATPEQVWAMFEQMDARLLLPVHHSTFELSDEPMDEPMRRLTRAAGAKQGRVVEPALGEIIVIPSANSEPHA